MEQGDRQSLLFHQSKDQTYNSIDSQSPHQLDGFDLESPSSSQYDSEVIEHAMPLWTIVCILSTAFSYGCILTTLFLITLPVECARIQATHPEIHKSVALGVFVAIAGVTQLISPLVGRCSDMYRPAVELQVGQRLPYLVVGAIITVAGLLAQMASSYAAFWLRYSVAFFLHMVGLNVQYAMMLAILADQVPSIQIGVANGVLALLLVTGSLFGFGLFHSFLGSDIQGMYGMYTCIVIVSGILTGTHAQDKDAALVRRDPSAIDLPAAAVAASNGASNGVTNGNVTSLNPKRGKRWHHKAKNAAKRAQQVIIMTPTQLLQSLVEPMYRMSWATLLRCYTIDVDKHHDFFIVTISRLFYYCGMSVQTFFLYFVHDIIHVTDHPEAAVASLAILGQCSGAFTCYPVGILSDQFMSGRRKPFVYAACVVLSVATLAMVTATTLDDMAMLCMTLGAANGIYLTMETSLAVDTLPARNCEQGDEGGSAHLLGIWGVAAFLGSALGPMIGGPLLYCIGSRWPPLSSTAGKGKNDLDEEYGLAGYAVVLSLSSFYFLCSALALRYVKRSEVAE
jgi:MFS family permease